MCMRRKLSSSLTNQLLVWLIEEDRVVGLVGRISLLLMKLYGLGVVKDVTRSFTHTGIL
jgi:hypothetical protein